MEYFFDIATPDEIKSFYPSYDDPEIMAMARQSLIDNPDENYAELTHLWHCRGNLEKEKECLNKIKDFAIKLRTSMLMYEWEG